LRVADRIVTPQRFAQGMTFDEYVKFVGTPENLAREAFGGVYPGPKPRGDWSRFLRERYAKARLTDYQAAAIRWLAAQPGGPANVLVISEEWSSDCRRDVPNLQRLADAGGLELRVFTRDGPRFLEGRPDPADSPNADLVLEYMNRRDDGEFASIPVAAFFDRDFNELYRYIELPAIYHKDLLVATIRAPRAGETPEQTKTRGTRDFFAMLETPFHDVWADAAIAEILSALYERQAVHG
jgi:hypothetical protein